MQQVVKKLCSNSAELHLKWKRQLNHVVKSKSYESPKAKLDMSKAVFYGDLLES